MLACAAAERWPAAPVAAAAGTLPESTCCSVALDSAVLPGSCCTNCCAACCWGSRCMVGLESGLPPAETAFVMLGNSALSYAEGTGCKRTCLDQLMCHMSGCSVLYHATQSWLHHYIPASWGIRGILGHKLNSSTGRHGTCRLAPVLVSTSSCPVQGLAAFTDASYAQLK